MNCCKKLMTALAVGMACLLGAAETEMPDDETDFEIDAEITVSELCKVGTLEPELAVRRLFSKSAADRWQTVTEDVFSKEQLRDFFCGAVIFAGSANKTRSIAGIYNPWWDTILITESILSEERTDEGESGEVRKIGSIVFMSGAAFREENGTETSVAEKMASPKGSPSEIVIDLTARTKKKFDGLYAGQKMPFLLDHPGENTELSKKQIVACAGVRLKMMQLLLNDKVRYEDAWSLAKVLRTGKRGTFDLLFPSGFGTMMSRTFCQLPKEVRADFEPYGYYPDKDGGKARIYIFINTEFPRLFAVTSLGLGPGNDTFEWYDLYRSDELAKVFEEANKGNEEEKK